MSSKADDFDVRYRDGRDGRAWGDGVNGPEDGYAADGNYAGDDHGAFGGTVDYDLGYDANGWDTQGFRSPAAGYLDNHETAYLGDGAAQGNGRGGSHARTASTPGRPAGLDTGGAGEHRPLASGPSRAASAAWPAAAGPARREVARRATGPRGQQVKVKGSWWRHWTWRKALGVLLGIIGGFIVLLALAVAFVYSKTPVPAEQMALSSVVPVSGICQRRHTSSAGSAPRTGRSCSYQQIRKRSSTRCCPPRTTTSSTRAVSRRPASCAPHGRTPGGGYLQGGSTITQQFVRNYYQGIGTPQTAEPEGKRDLRRDEGRQAEVEAVDPGELPQHDLPRPGCLRHGGGGADVLQQAGVQASASAGARRPCWPRSSSSRAPTRCRSTGTSSRPAGSTSGDGLVTMGTDHAADGRTMKFPAFGDHMPGSYGNAVWDPYVMNMVKNELGRLPLHRCADRQRRLQDRHHQHPAQDGRAVPGGHRRRAADRRGRRPVFVAGLHAHRRGAGEPGDRRRSRRSTAGPAIRDRSTTATVAVITAKECNIISCQ